MLVLLRGRLGYNKLYVGLCAQLGKVILANDTDASLGPVLGSPVTCNCWIEITLRSEPIWRLHVLYNFLGLSLIGPIVFHEIWILFITLHITKARNLF